MSHPRQYQMVGGGGGGGGGGNATQFGDTTYTKIFVGGLAWETQRETLKRYFEQFGEILEAVVITDKVSGKSKGYGFVTFKDPDSAMRACQDPSPVIDGRRANCNIASLGAHKSRPSPSPHHGTERLRPPSGSMGKPSHHHHHHHGPSTNFRQSNPHFSFPPYSIYGYSGYPQELYAMNYYNVYSGQQISSYYSSPSGSTAAGVYYGYYPVYTQQQGQSSQIQGFGIQYPQSTTQYPYLPQPYQAVGILPLPASVSASSSSSSSSSMGATTTATGEVTRTTTATEQGS